MKSTEMVNASGSVLRFSIDNGPGEESDLYEVQPGESCHIPEGYVKSGLYERFAKGLVPADKAPKAAEPIQGKDRPRR